MTGNLLGKSIDAVFDKQIDNRQKLYGAGYLPGEDKVQRTPEVSNYLNNRNAWIKMASGVNFSGSAGEEKLKQNLGTSNNNYLSESDITSFKGNGLAKNFVLFNTLRKYNGDGTYTDRSGVVTDISPADPNQNPPILSPFQKSINKMYGGVGSSIERGLQPVAGITDISVECINRGSIRKATVNIKAYNKFQFNVIELLYLRLGYFVMLEWGWDKYVSNVKEGANATTPSSVTIEDTGQTLIERLWFDGKARTQNDFISSINTLREEYLGNYDGFLGKIVNFNWKLNVDNTYDITVNLLTVGSVIESINANLPALNIDKNSFLEQQRKLYLKLGLNDGQEGGENAITQEQIDSSNNTLLTNLGSDVISQFLGTTIINFFNSEFKYKELLFAPNLITETRHDPNKESGFFALSTFKAIRKKIPKNLRYFIRFGKFLEVIQNRVIVDIVNGDNVIEGEVEFDLDTDNILCNYETNLIPLAPNKAVFSIMLDEEFKNAVGETTKFNSNYDAVDRFNKPLRKFAHKENGVVYGKLLNIYLNFNFIEQAFQSAKDKEDNVSLYTFLQNLCDGINDSTGQCTKLEVVLKKDKKVIIIDQNNIKGYDNLLNNSPTTPIELYGYNSNGSSNFVKSFDFQTKITPDLVNLITAGSAAINEKEESAAPFSRWNKGLKNRVSNNLMKTTVLTEAEKEEANDQKFKDALSAAIKSGDALFLREVSGVVSKGYSFKYGGVLVTGIFSSTVEVNPFSRNRESDSKNEDLLSVGLNQYKQAVLADKQKYETGDDGTTRLRNVKEAEKNYKFFVTKALGGKSGFSSYEKVVVNKKEKLFKEQLTELNTSIGSSMFWEFDNVSFRNQGKNAFKLYLSDRDKQEAIDNDSVSSNGFIPLELGVEIDGMSGFKIFDMLDVNTEFLPSSYPKALKFLLRKINHKVSRNVWETSLGTFSVPVSKKAPSLQKAYKNKAATTIEANPVTATITPLTELSTNQQTAYDKAEIRSEGFKDKVKLVAANLGTTEVALVKTMYKESKINESARNPIGCVGLIQLCPDKSRGTTKTIRGKVYNLTEVQNMTGVEQLDVVQEYYLSLGANPSKAVLSTIDIYMLTFYPYAATQPADYVLGSEKSDEFAATLAQQNPAVRRVRVSGRTVSNVRPKTLEGTRLELGTYPVLTKADFEVYVLS